MKCIILSCLAIAVVAAQEKNAGAQPLTLQSPSIYSSYSPAEVKVLDTLDYGQTRQSWDRSGGPRFRAFIFSGYGGDKVDIVLKSDEPKPFLALADSTLNLIGSGSNHLILSLPYRGPDIEVYYVLFPAAQVGNSRVTMRVNRLASRFATLTSVTKPTARGSHGQGGMD